MHILRSARAQVAAAAVLFVLLLAAISVVAIASARNHQSQLQSLEETSLAATTLEHARAQFFLEMSILASMVLTEEPGLIGEYRLAQAELHQDMEQARSLALARDDTEDLATLEGVVQQMDALEQLGELVIPVVAAGHTDTLKALLGVYEGEAWVSGQEAVYGVEEAVQRKQETLASEHAAAARDADITLWSLVGLGSVAFLLAVGGAVALTASIVRPLASLRAKARAITAGDPHVRADVSGPEEITSLAQDFNEMTETLLKRTDELQRRHQQLSLLHRAVSALSQTLSTHGVLTLSRKLVSECQGSQHVTVWEVQDGEARRWASNPHRRSENPGVVPSPASAERVKLTVRQGTPLVIPESGDGAARGADPAKGRVCRLRRPTGQPLWRRHRHFPG